MDKKSMFSKSFREYRKHKIPPLVELLMSEEIYIKRMELIINGYIAEYKDENSSIPVPESLRGVGGLLFANINDIYEWHKNYFLKALMEHQNSLTEFGKVFTHNEHQFHMYAKYCYNSKISNYLVTTNIIYFDMVRNKLGHKFEINDLLITPVQRMLRYPLLLSDIVKHIKKNKLTEHLESLNAALSMVQTVCNNVNDFTALQGISNFDRRVSEQGKLLFHGQLTCKYDGKKRKQYVFLFQQLIIFTTKEEAKSKYRQPTYKFCLQIPMNKLQLNELQNNKFLLKSTDPNSLALEIVCKAETTEMYQQWLNFITMQLSTQRKFIFTLVNPSPNEDQGNSLV